TCPYLRQLRRFCQNRRRLCTCWLVQQCSGPASCFLCGDRELLCQIADKLQAGSRCGGSTSILTVHSSDENSNQNDQSAQCGRGNDVLRTNFHMSSTLRFGS